MKRIKILSIFLFFLSGTLLSITHWSPLKSQTHDSSGVTADRKTVEVVGPKWATTKKPEKKPQEIEKWRPTIRDTAWIIIDSVTTWKLIPSDDHYAFHFSLETQTLEETPPSYVLEDSALLAIESSPTWLQKEVYDNFRRLSGSYQKTYARRILLSEPIYRDEIAFQVAHLSPHTLTNSQFDPVLLDTNVAQLYSVDSDLQFVELVEYGVSGVGNWYTTTRYRIIDEQGDTVWAEIPKEIYYWWVMMPKLSDELPRMDASVYNRFWRDYLYNYADPGYPLLKDVLDSLKILWDGAYHVWDADRPFTDTMFAVDAIGKWVSETVPYPASGNRPIQPNVIAHEHNGNCGELQDLLNAAARTALLPVLSVSNWPEDHVWNEVYHWNGNWYEYQVDLGHGATHIRDSTTAYDPGKHCSVIFGWRADGYTWSETEGYTPTCTLTVKVRDVEERPIDGAEVVLCSRYYADPGTIVIAHWAHTDHNGEFTVVVGDTNDFFARVDCPLGHAPSSPNQVYWIIENSQPGAHYYWTCDLSGSLPETPIMEISNPPIHHFRLSVEYDIIHRTLYGGSYWQYDFTLDDEDYSDIRVPGDVDFFICDSANYYDYLNDLSFSGYELRENLSHGLVDFDLPFDEDFYIVFSQDERLVISGVLETHIDLYRSIIPPEPFSLLFPEDNDTLNLPVTLDWEDAEDPNPGDRVFYGLYLSLDQDFTDPVLIDSLVESEYLLREVLFRKPQGFLTIGKSDAILENLNTRDTIPTDTTYYWKVKAYDEWGAEQWSTEVWSFYALSAPQFIRGDADSNLAVEMPDAVYILRYKFIPGSPPPSCMDTGDADDNGLVEMPDAVYILRYKFIPGSPPPPLPFPGCGVDPTEDELGCEEHPCMGR